MLNGEELSSGTLPPKQTLDGFYVGESVPVNEALSRIFIQLHITEHTGRGIPKITSVYGKDNISIRENNIVVTIPYERIVSLTGALTGGISTQVNTQVNSSIKSINDKILSFCIEPKSIIEIADYLGYKERKSVRKYIVLLLEMGRIAMTVPDKTNSRNQKYVAIK